MKRAWRSAGNRQAFEFLIRNPQLFTAVGIGEGAVLEQLVDEWIARTRGSAS